MDDIRILQLGEEDWGLSYQIPGGIRIYHEKPELRRAGDAFELVFWDREPREQELENLRNVTKAYTLYLVEGVQLGEKAKELFACKMGKKIAREQILKYKEMEHLVQTGDYYRLVNPFENNNHVLWQFVSKDKKETIVCGVRLHSEANPHIYLLYPQGLDADMKYEDVVTGKVYTGAALMNAGLPLPLTTGDYQPIKFTFRAVEK